MQTLVRALRSLAVVSLVCLGGCTVAEQPSSSAIDARAESLGFIAIERASAEAPELTTPRATLGAAFARYHGVAGQEVLGLLGDVPAALDVDTCSVAETGEVTLAEPDARVELLDAGPIDVHVAGGTARVLSSTFPELDSLVAGVFYGGNVQLPASEADVDEYRVQAGGGPGIPAFEVLIVAPPGFSELAFSGAALAASPIARRTVDAEIAWDAGDPRDRVEIELAAGGRTLECVALDDGSFRIRAEHLAELEPDADARVTLRRVRSEAFDATGLDMSWVRVATTRTFPVVLR